jgi:tetratricopeptide (TPR) repeat protein
MPDLGESVAFRLTGRKSNRDGIGACITLDTAKGRQSKALQAGSGFLSQHSKEVFFGLGNDGGLLRATVRWPSGLVQVFSDLRPGQRISIEEGADEYRAETFRARTAAKTKKSFSPGAASTPLPLECDLWLLAPVTAPDFALPDISGAITTLSGFRGRPVLLSLAATECPPCETQLRQFERAHSRWVAEGLQLVVFSVNNASEAAAVRKYAGDRGISFPIVLASEDMAGVYNLLYRYMFDRHRDLGIPTSFLIDEEGAIIKVYQGPVDPQQVEEDFRNMPRTASERLKMALPFAGVTDINEFHRNYLTYGFVYFHRDYLGQAEESFLLAVRDDPRSAEAYYGLGSVYLKREKPDDARQLFERVLKLQPRYPDIWTNAWNNLGVIAMQADRSEEAVKNFEQSVRQNPKNLIALNNLGNAYRQQQRWTDARAIFERALQVNPDDAEANYSLGMVFARVDDTDRTYQYLRRALTIRPHYPEALNNLGILYVRTGRLDEAISTFKECIRVAPEFDGSYLNLAKIYEVKSEPAKARDVLLELLKQHPDHAMAQKAVAEPR